MGAPHGPLKPHLKNLKRFMSYFRLPKNTRKPKYGIIPSPKKPLDLSKPRKKKSDTKIWPLLTQYDTPPTRNNISQSIQPRQEWPAVPPELLLEPQESLFKPPEFVLKPNESPFKPPALIIKPQEPLFKKPGSIFKPPEPIFKQPGSIFKPPEPIFKQPGSVIKPSEPIFKIPGSVIKPPEPIFKIPGPVVKPIGSVVKSSGSVIKPPGSVVKPPGSVTKEPSSFLEPTGCYLTPPEFVFKTPKPPLKRSGSIVKSPKSRPIKKTKTSSSTSKERKKYLDLPMPIGYKKGTLMYYGSMDQVVEVSSDEDSDDESADVDVVGFTDEENPDLTSDEDSDDSDDDVSIVEVKHDDDDINMIIHPDPPHIQQLLAPLAQRRNYLDETSDYDDNEYSEEHVARVPYDDSYLKDDEGYVDELDAEYAEYNLMDNAQFPVNPSYEIARIARSNLNRREALERIMGYL